MTRMYLLSRLVPWTPVLLAGCLSVDTLTEGNTDAGAGPDSATETTDGSTKDATVEAEVEVPPTEACLARAVDPLVGAWKRRSGSGTCEFFSNGRYTAGCDLLRGDPFEWDLLDDGRYLFNATNSFGSIIETCSARPTFDRGCDSLQLALDCEGDENEVELVRDE